MNENTNPKDNHETEGTEPESELYGADPLENAAQENGGDQALQAELREAKDQMMRALAEAENTRKRAAKERMDAGKFAIAGFARDLLEVADNLRRAMDAVPEDLAQSDERVKGLLDGIEATERTLLKAFENNKVRKIDPLGDIFDPNFHEVMFETPMPGKQPGTIIQVLETGYVLNDRLLRPARVGVVKDESGGAAAGGSKAPGENLDTEA